jgi:Tol biopolymer transport system component
MILTIPIQTDYFFRLFWLVLPALLLAGCSTTPSSDEHIIRLPDHYFHTFATEPDWSPDGNLIAYQYGARGGIWLLDLKADSIRFVTEGRHPAWSPDGTYLVYVLQGDIYKINIETHEITRLTDWGGSFYPSWSPDGEKIAFDTNHNDPNGANVIWVMNADGTNKQDISQHGVGEWRQPSWSPDGEWIIHIRYVGDTFSSELFKMRPDGTEGTRLTVNDRSDKRPAWSPDRQQIAWNSIFEGDDPRSGIWMMQPDGTNQRLFIARSYNPSWSPDGMQLIFYYKDYEKNTGTLALLNADGSGFKLLIDSEDYNNE